MLQASQAFSYKKTPRVRGPMFGRYHPDLVLITALTGLPGEVY